MSSKILNDKINKVIDIFKKYIDISTFNNDNLDKGEFNDLVENWITELDAIRSAIESEPDKCKHDLVYKVENNIGITTCRKCAFRMTYKIKEPDKSPVEKSCESCGRNKKTPLCIRNTTCDYWIPKTPTKDDVVEKPTIGEFDNNDWVLFSDYEVLKEKITTLENGNYRLMGEVTDAHHKQCELEAELKKRDDRWEELKVWINNHHYDSHYETIVFTISEIRDYMTELEKEKE